MLFAAGTGKVNVFQRKVAINVDNPQVPAIILKGSSLEVETTEGTSSFEDTGRESGGALNQRRSGGKRIRSLTNRLNVPVVR